MASPCSDCKDKWYAERHVNCYQDCERLREWKESMNNSVDKLAN
jgi:hypothetical protein